MKYHRLLKKYVRLFDSLRLCQGLQFGRMLHLLKIHPLHPRPGFQQLEPKMKLVE